MTNNPFLVSPLTTDFVRSFDMAQFAHWHAYCTRYASDPICAASLETLNSDLARRF